MNVNVNREMEESSLHGVVQELVPGVVDSVELEYTVEAVSVVWDAPELSVVVVLSDIGVVIEDVAVVAFVVVVVVVSSKIGRRESTD